MVGGDDDGGARAEALVQIVEEPLQRPIGADGIVGDFEGVRTEVMPQVIG